MTRTQPLTRRACLGVLGRAGAGLLGSALPSLPLSASPAPETPPTGRRAASFAGLLGEAVTAMEEGRHPQALAPLRAALTEGRNDPSGALALGTLYLHAGSPARALREFARARALAPGDPLPVWGESLALVAQGGLRVPVMDIPVDAVPAAPLLADYLRLLRGDAAGVQAATEAVTADEADPLRLEVAAFAALRAGDTARGESLLKAFLERPKVRAFEEERALILPFLPRVPAQGAAPVLPSAIEFPEPKAGAAPQSGLVTLTPPSPLPAGTAMVIYTVDGTGGYSATTNNAPYVSEWNSARYPNGQYVLRATATDAEGRALKEETRAVSVVNADAPASRLLDKDVREEFRVRLLRLLTPRPSRKAAHYALAEQATKRGDNRAALDHIEAVVAIDPLYNNARTSLRQYNEAVIGDCDGIWCGLTDEKVVALTFDDGPKAERTPLLLNALKKEGAVGTFFIVGARAEEARDLILRMDAEGHEVANHSYTHPNLTFLDGVGVTRELCRTSAVVREITGKRPRFFRPPGGNVNSAVSAAAEDLGLSGAYWTADGLKFEMAPFTPQDLARYVLSKVRPGAIVLLHNAPDNTIAAIPLILRGLRARGYQAVTMGDLMRRCRPGTARHAGVKPQAAKE